MSCADFAGILGVVVEILFGKRCDGASLVPRAYDVRRSTKLAGQDAKLGPRPDQIRAARPLASSKRRNQIQQVLVAEL